MSKVQEGEQFDFHPLISGAWDIHVHAAPSLFERWGDAWALAEACQKASMKGFVLKAHHGSTVEVARLLSVKYPEMEISGGLTLNSFVGALNPLAVESACSLGAKIIWLPTIDAAFHEKTLGQLGGFKFQQTELSTTLQTGLTITDEANRLKKPMQDIIAILDEKSCVLATGHISPEEIFELQRYIMKERRSVRLLVNHVFFKTPGLSQEQLRQLTNSWTWFETVYLTVSAMGDLSLTTKVSHALQALPEMNWVMASDSGQKANPCAPEALDAFVRALLEHGVSAFLVRKMLHDHPAELLGI